MNRPLPPNQHLFEVASFNLAATFDSGQAFRWQQVGGAWEGVFAGRWVRLTPVMGGLRAEVAAPVADWQWLSHYLRLDEDPDTVRATLPPDPPLVAALDACAGLRLLRQEPWECLASFLLSSTKQIVQIRRIVATLCARFGDPVTVPRGKPTALSFPSPMRLAACSEAELRAFKMGFRARYLREAARRVAAAELDLVALPKLPLMKARSALLEVPGVGPKIADCVLLFSLGFDRAFPVDVWMAKALRQLYFPRRRVTLRELRAFSEKHFGRHAGYAQQCLFHHARMLAGAIGTAPADAVKTTLEVLFTPAEFAALATRDLRTTTCVVFDVLRATSSMVTALANGASAILPVTEIPEALAARARLPDALLAGERDGLRIRADLTGGVEFDLGNSPREFTPERVRGRTIIMSTTNGTRALQACAGARHVLVGSFLNLGAVAAWLDRQPPEHLLIVAGGTLEQAAWEDTLAAGALADRVWPRLAPEGVADSAQIARQVYQAHRANLLGAMAQSRNGRRLLARPELRDDVAFCLRRDVFDLVPALSDAGMVTSLV